MGASERDYFSLIFVAVQREHYTWIRQKQAHQGSNRVTPNVKVASFCTVVKLLMFNADVVVGLQQNIRKNMKGRIKDRVRVKRG